MSSKENVLRFQFYSFNQIQGYDFRTLLWWMVTSVGQMNCQRWRWRYISNWCLALYLNYSLHNCILSILPIHARVLIFFFMLFFVNSQGFVSSVSSNKLWFYVTVNVSLFLTMFQLNCCLFAGIQASGHVQAPSIVRTSVTTSYLQCRSLSFALKRSQKWAL